MLNRIDNSEHSHVSYNIYQYIVHQRSHTSLTASNNSQHDISCLRDWAERHEALELALTNGKEVGDGDAQYNNDVEQILPVSSQRTESLHHDNHESKGCSTLRTYAQITSNRCGSALIGVSCPEVEGNKRKLEAQTTEEEHQAHNSERWSSFVERRSWHQFSSNIVEVESSCSSVNEWDTIQHHTAREGSNQNILGSSLCALFLVLVKSYQAGHRHWGSLQSKEEQQERTARYHDEHTEQCWQHQHVELTFVLYIQCTRLNPGLRHHYYYQCTSSKNSLHYLWSLCCYIHTTESFCRLSRQAYYCYNSQQAHSQCSQCVSLYLQLRNKEVGKEHQKQWEDQEGLGNHI